MVRMTVRVMIRFLVKIGIIVNPKWHPTKGSKELIKSFTKQAITCTIIYIYKKHKRLHSLTSTFTFHFKIIISTKSKINNTST